MSFPKIKLGSQVIKKSRFDLSHDVNTTADFGFVYPMSITSMIPNSTLKINGEHLVRLAPMSLPTFGRMQMKVYHAFVPIPDIYEPFENLLSAKSYTGGTSSYVPTQVPSISMKVLLSYLLTGLYCPVSSYSSTGSVFSLNDLSDSSSVTFRNFFGSCYSPDQRLNFVFSNFEPLPSGSSFSKIKSYIPLDNADYVISASSDSNYKYAFRLNNRARLFRDVCLALGYQLTIDDVPDMSLLPLLAYYKAYFDIFDPQRNSTWTDTPAYKLMEYIRVNNAVNINTWDSTTTFGNLVKNFLDSLTDCFFVDNQDFVSAHIATPTIAPSESVNLAYSSVGGSPSSIDIDTNSQVNLGSAESSSTSSLIRLNYLTQSALDIIKKLSHFRNIETSLGGRIDKYLKVIYGTDELHNERSNFVGTYNVDCKISDVMNQSQSSEGLLGDYAGRGIGFGNKSFSYDAKTFGYFITLFAIVPRSNYFQGIAPHLMHKNRFEFYNMFDSMGYELNNKSAVACLTECNSGTTFADDIQFGFIPRHSGYKIHNNVCAGDISLPSMRSQFLGYSLDKFVTPTRIISAKLDTTNGVQYSDIYYNNTLLPLASTSYRYINRYPWLSNFNRMFYNGGMSDDMPVTIPQIIDDYDNFTEDNFYINNILNIEYYAPMKPISESFETEGESGHTVDIVKS